MLKIKMGMTNEEADEYVEKSLDKIESIVDDVEKVIEVVAGITTVSNDALAILAVVSAYIAANYAPSRFEAHFATVLSYRITTKMLEIAEANGDTIWRDEDETIN